MNEPFISFAEPSACIMLQRLIMIPLAAGYCFSSFLKGTVLSRGYWPWL
jgi:hypothetical protein